MGYLVSHIHSDAVSIINRAQWFLINLPILRTKGLFWLQKACAPFFSSSDLVLKDVYRELEDQKLSY